MNRRTLLATGGAIGAVALAGCADVADSSEERPHLPEPAEEYACLTDVENAPESVVPDSFADADRERIIDFGIYFEREYRIVASSSFEVSVSLEDFERKNDRVVGLLLQSRFDPLYDDGESGAGEASFEYSAVIVSDDRIFRGELDSSPGSEATAFDVEPETWIAFHC